MTNRYTLDHISKASHSVRYYLFTNSKVQYHPHPLAGLYSGAFATYLVQNQTSNKGTNATATKRAFFYPICTLYALSVAVVFCDIYHITLALVSSNLIRM
jgi:uncharacterized membrane protein YiaA